MNYSEQLKLEEYRSLFEEHRKNRTYILERPIIILGLAAIALQYSYKLDLGQFILAGLIFILCYNLWFTGNRLQSAARIVAYIQLVHEPEGELRSKWIGWESILREYRIWIGKHKKGELEIIQNEKLKEQPIPFRLMFYPAIWVLHLVIVLLTFTIAIIPLMKSLPLSIEDVVGPIASCVATVIFMYYAFGELNPKRVSKTIELERATWFCVFEEFYKQKELRLQKQNKVTGAWVIINRTKKDS
jgi:hypothetical protein